MLPEVFLAALIEIFLKKAGMLKIGFHISLYVTRYLYWGCFYSVERQRSLKCFRLWPFGLLEECQLCIQFQNSKIFIYVMPFVLDIRNWRQLLFVLLYINSFNLCHSFYFAANLRCVSSFEAMQPDTKFDF